MNIYSFMCLQYTKYKNIIKYVQSFLCKVENIQKIIKYYFPYNIDKTFNFI